MDDPKIKLAQARLEAAKLRTRAAHQDTMAQSYRRQATKPGYDGQIEICLGKAAEVEALAAENRARADVIKAEAEAEYREATSAPKNETMAKKTCLPTANDLSKDDAQRNAYGL